MKRNLFWVCLLGIFTLAGCSQPAITDECLVGTWEITNSRTFAPALLPEGAFVIQELTFMGSEGNLTYTFQKDGRLIVQANSWNGRLTVNSGGILMLLELFLNGKADAEFSLQADTLQVGKLLSSQMTYAADLDGIAMQDSKNPGEFLPLFTSAHPAAQYQCQRNVLRLSFANWPAVSDPLQFNRR